MLPEPEHDCVGLISVSYCDAIGFIPCRLTKSYVEIGMGGKNVAIWEKNKATGNIFLY